MLDFETGVHVGQALAKLRDHGKRLDTLEAEVHDLRSLITRAMLLAALWLVGVAGNIKADTIGEAGAAFLRAWLK